MGHQAVVFDNLSHGRRDLLPPGVEFVEGELADRPALERSSFSQRTKANPSMACFTLPH
jgi:UDP-glucose 4-epimerase